MRVASRFMLPVEMFLGLKLMALGFIGGFGGGTLHTNLVESGETWQWFLSIFPLGLYLFLISAREWFWMRYADKQSIFKSVSARSVGAFFGCITWACAFLIIATKGWLGSSMYFALLAPIAAVFHSWSYVENLKVRYALNDRVPTSGLEFHR
jgi:hypothetical protein